MVVELTELVMVDKTTLYVVLNPAFLPNIGCAAVDSIHEYESAEGWTGIT